MTLWKRWMQGRSGEVLRSYTDNRGEQRHVSAETVERLQSALGAPVRRRARSRGTRAFSPHWRRDGGRGWGIAMQLYAVRSRANWGIGDFADLERIVEWAEALGADYIGLNPLHALFPGSPGRRSPYFPSSRLFLNPLYIAVETLAQDLGLSLDLDAEATTLIGKARAASDVDYRAVSAAKLPALRRLFDAARGMTDAPWQAELSAFETAGGEGLRRQALFDAISVAYAEDGAGFHAWPEELRSPDSEAAGLFAEAHTDDIAFHSFLQWAADRQLRRAVTGRRCALYLDIAIGAAPDGAEVWSRPSDYVLGARLGAPPDLMASGGQDWGLAPLNPRRLVDRDFTPFRNMLTASMRHAGAVRIDHILGFDRQYIIPEGMESSTGGYVSFPRSGMIEATATVSREAQCLVIGEALGTVPEGLVDDLHKADIFSYEVVRWARTTDGSFLPADAYPEKCLAVVGTHDIATTPGFVAGLDIALRLALNQLDDEGARRELAERAEDVRQLSDLWGVEPDQGADAFVTAAHSFLARSSAALVMGTLEDILLQEEQVNVPGTVDEYPNWSTRLPADLEDWMSDEGVARRTIALRRR